MGVVMVWAATTHRGRIRPVNEDAVLAGPRIFAVADGVGGAVGGRHASTSTIAALVRADQDGSMSLERLRCVIADVNSELLARQLDGSGTTLTGLGVCNGGSQPQVVLFNVGDSRVYRLRDGELEQLSNDHSVVAELLRDGEITEAEAARHPDRFAITRALGVAAELDIDMSTLDVRVDDRYLVCSDGLTNEIPDEELQRQLMADPAASQVVQALLDEVLRRGARDNVSVVVTDVVSIDADVIHDEPTRKRSALGRARRRRRAAAGPGDS